MKTLSELFALRRDKRAALAAKDAEVADKRAALEAATSAYDAVREELSDASTAFTQAMPEGQLVGPFPAADGGPVFALKAGGTVAEFAPVDPASISVEHEPDAGPVS